MGRGVSIFHDVRDAAYGDIVEQSPDAMVFQTPAYLAFLAEVLPSAEFAGFIVEGRAAMPSFVMRTAEGAVLNALPYFGGHGDIVTTAGAEASDSAAIIRAVETFCRDTSVDAVNIVAHPLTPHWRDGASDIFAKWDERIGQVSRLGSASTREAAIEASLLACSGKTRNLARKGLRGGFRIERDDDATSWRDLVRFHRDSILAMGGHAKTEAEFAALRRALGDQCRLYVARKDGAFAGALLVLAFKGWVEYFTPVSYPDFRSEQVVPALIIAAMSDARMSGAQWWNWGGTWHQQPGVRHFKAGWGAIEFPYAYIGALLGERLRGQAPADLLQAFPRFYVAPFDSLG